VALTDNLVAFWELEEASGTRNDSASTNHLTDNNTVTQNTGKVGNCAEFNGANEYLSIADNAALSAGDTDFSFNVWVNPDVLAPGNNTVLSKTLATGASDEEYFLRYLNVVGNWHWQLQGGTSYPGVTALGTPATGTWTMLTVWHDSVNNEIGIVVNAGTAATTSWAGGVNDSGGPFNIGRYATAGVQYFDGLIDQVGFWRRVLTSGDRTTLYNAGAGLSYAAMGGGSPPSGGHDLPLLGVGKGLLPFWPAWWRYQRMQEKRIRQAERDCLRRHAA
jgi:hypothetical protein